MLRIEVLNTHIIVTKSKLFNKCGLLIKIMRISFKEAYEADSKQFILKCLKKY